MRLCSAHSVQIGDSWSTLINACINLTDTLWMLRNARSVTGVLLACAWFKFYSGRRTCDSQACDVKLLHSIFINKYLILTMSQTTTIKSQIVRLSTWRNMKHPLNIPIGVIWHHYLFTIIIYWIYCCIIVLYITVLLYLLNLTDKFLVLWDYIFECLLYAFARVNDLELAVLVWSRTFVVLSLRFNEHKPR